jgi:hypothetical protein
MTPTSIQRVLLAAALATGAAAAQAADYRFNGQISQHNDVVQIDFNVAAPTTVTLWTDSWQGGLNIDPLLTLFNADGSLVSGGSNDDNNSFGASQGYYDAGLSLTLAGSYRLTLTAASNEAIGPLLANGFSYSADAPIALADWTQPSSDINKGDQKGGFWQVHLDGVTLAAAVPEPASGAMLLAGLLALGFMAGRRQRD